MSRNRRKQRKYGVREEGTSSSRAIGVEKGTMCGWDKKITCVCKKVTLEPISLYVEKLRKKKKERKRWRRKARKEEWKGSRKCVQKSMS